MILLKFIIGFALLILASVNHFIIYSTRCDVGSILNYVTLRRVKAYIILGLSALIFQLIIEYYNISNMIDPYMCRLLGFLPLVVILLSMNLELLLRLPNLQYEYPIKLNPKADTFYTLTGLITLCLFFDRIPFKPCLIVTISTMVLTVSTLISSVFLIKYMRIAYTLVDRIDVSVPVKIFVFASMVFGFQSMASFCSPEVACWFALIGVSSLLLSTIVIICHIRSLAIV